MEGQQHQPSPPVYFNFAIEDTSERCYRDVISSLVHRGWKKVPFKKRSKLEKRRLPISKDIPLLLMTLNEKDVDFAELQPFQVCNHFEGIDQLTTKRGFCELLREMCWICQDHLDISPRCYNLGDPIHREEFIEDFRISAILIILKWAITATQPPPPSSSTTSTITTTTSTTSTVKPPLLLLTNRLLKTCLSVASRYLRIRQGGEWPGVERTLSVLSDLPDISSSSTAVSCSSSSSGQQHQQQHQNIFGIDEPEWHAILQASYAIAEATDSSASNYSFACAATPATEPRPATAAVDSFFASEISLLRAAVLSSALSSLNRQSAMDGALAKNVWVVKAPDACRGVGLKVLYRLEDILECERGMGGRTAQKVPT